MRQIIDLSTHCWQISINRASESISSFDIFLIKWVELFSVSLFLALARLTCVNISYFFPLSLPLARARGFFSTLCVRASPKERKTTKTLPTNLAFFLSCLEDTNESAECVRERKKERKEEKEILNDNHHRRRRRRRKRELRIRNLGSWNVLTPFSDDMLLKIDQNGWTRIFKDAPLPGKYIKACRLQIFD